MCIRDSDYITRFDSTDFDTKFACEVKGFDAIARLDRKIVNRTDIYSQLALAATDEAMQDAGLSAEKIVSDRCGVVFGSGIGGMTTYHTQQKILFEQGPSRISPFFVPMMISDIAAGLISMRYILKGPNYATTSACATSSNAIADAFMLIQRGNADMMVAGGSESVVSPMAIGGFNAMKALSTRNDDPKTASRPFDTGRDGFVLGEGAGVFILELLESAINRGAKIHAELVGCGLTADAHHITAPHPEGEGAARAMILAVQDAGLNMNDINYINVHGTSTPLGDIAEVSAIKRAFGDHSKNLLISGTKSMIGHLLGAAGVVQAIATVLMMENSLVHPTINNINPDPLCDIDFVPNIPRKHEINAAVSNAFGFGGHNVSLCFRKYTE